MVKSAAEELGEFFDYLWEDTSGLVYLPVIRQGEISQKMFEWPRQRGAAITHVLGAVADGGDAYVSPAIFSEAPPRKANVKGSHVLWVDFDNGGAPLDKMRGDGVPTPSLRLETSPGREHAYWKLDSFLDDTRMIEECNRSLTYMYGGDTSGWDANQFLRPPATVNTAFGKEGREPNNVVRASEYGDKIVLQDFDNLQPFKQIVKTDMLSVEDVPPLEDVLALNAIPADMWQLINTPRQDVQDRSGALMRLAYMAAEAEFSDGEIYAVLERVDTMWGKYLGRHDRERQLIDLINRARQKVGYNYKDNSNVQALVESLRSGGADSATSGAPAVMSFMELLESDIKVEWLVEGLLSTTGLGLISGEPSAGKTQMLIQMGCSLAVQRQFLTWDKADAPKKVLFLSLEMDAAPLKLFLSKIIEEYTEEERKLLNENFHILPVGYAVPLDSEAGQAFLDSLIEAHQPDLLIVDSFAQVISTAVTDEVAVRSMVNYLQRKVRLKHKVAIVLVHHTRKLGNASVAGDPTLSDIYGNVYLTAGIDFGFIIRKGYEPGRMTLYQVKVRLGPEGLPTDIVRNENLTYTIEEKKEGSNGFTPRHISGNGASPVVRRSSGDSNGGGGFSFSV